jgi:hypothetical protein
MRSTPPLKSVENLIETGEFQRAYEEIVADLATAPRRNQFLPKKETLGTAGQS